MKSKIINWLAGTEEGTLSVCITESTGRNIALSLRAAEHIAKNTDRGKVLYINTVQTSRQLGASIRKHANPEYTADTEDSRIMYETVPSGLLTDEDDDLARHLASGRVQYVIVNCWEMASKNYRRKSDLVFMLNRWMEEYGTTIIVFAEQMRSSPETQKIHVGMGIGKLSLIANEIRVFKKKEKEKDKDVPVVYKPSAEAIEKYEEYLREPIPVWMPATRQEEEAGLRVFYMRHIKISQFSAESPEALRKRLMSYVANDMERYADRYEAVLGDIPIRVENAPEEYFRTPLPEGEEIVVKAASSWKPDRAPVRNENTDYGDFEVTESGIEPRSTIQEENFRARAKLL